MGASEHLANDTTAMAHAQTKGSHMRLYTEDAERLYLNPTERQRFLEVALTAPPLQRRFAYTLAHTGMRISEALSLTFGSLQLDRQVVAVRTLKRRDAAVIREIPIPPPLVAVLQEVSGPDDQSLWLQNGHPISRSTAYNWIKRIMTVAEITGPKACPKGLRHAFGVHATLSGVQLHMLQGWMGHASMETTAIYATVLGPDQITVAKRMW